MLMPHRSMAHCHAVAWFGMLSYSTPSMSNSIALYSIAAGAVGVFVVEAVVYPDAMLA